MNRVAKGNRVELMLRKILEADGYLVDKKNRTKWQSPDLFGVFDLVAIKESRVRFIQVKSNRSHFYIARKEISHFLKLHNLNIEAEIWLYQGKGKWRSESLSPDSY